MGNCIATEEQEISKMAEGAVGADMNQIGDQDLEAALGLMSS